MSKLVTENEVLKQAALEIIRVFEASKLDNSVKNLTLEIKQEQDENSLRLIAILSADKEVKQSLSEELVLGASKKMLKQATKRLVYQLLSAEYKLILPWGILVGVRPTKLVDSFIAQGMTKAEIEKVLSEDYLLRRDKIKALLQVLDNSACFGRAASNSISIYINIPFCPSRCLYCSFAAEVVQQKNNRIDTYVDALIKELELSASAYKDYFVESIYFGGGTPSVLNAEQIERIWQTLKTNYNLSNLKEFSFEAGRPKTINASLLEKLKSIGVNRISINPQSVNSKTLELIGRSHNQNDIEKAFDLARAFQFDAINADIIAGLYGETLSDFEKTLNSVIALNPENITVHSLSTKSKSDFVTKKARYRLPAVATVAEQIASAERVLTKNYYLPYYLYRQKKIAANLENVGYSLSGHQCLYNIRIIQEKQTILAFGASASNKFYNAETDKLNNFINIKNIDLYIERVGEMAEKKL